MLFLIITNHFFHQSNLTKLGKPYFDTFSHDFSSALYLQLFLVSLIFFLIKNETNNDFSNDPLLIFEIVQFYQIGFDSAISLQVIVIFRADDYHIIIYWHIWSDDTWDHLMPRITSSRSFSEIVRLKKCYHQSTTFGNYMSIELKKLIITTLILSFIKEKPTWRLLKNIRIDAVNPQLRQANFLQLHILP